MLGTKGGRRGKEGRVTTLKVEAALILCELATTKDDNAQELLVRAGIGDILVACLRHSSQEVKRSAMLAIERWMYSDDRITLYAIEFFLSLVQSGIFPSKSSFIVPLRSRSPWPRRPSIPPDKGAPYWFKSSLQTKTRAYATRLIGSRN
jgi:hypothetical protein